jgi:hypothetical protein
VSTTILIHCYDAHCGAHEIQLREINGVRISNQVPARFEVGFGSLLFIANKMGDLSLQEPKLQEITGSDTDRFPPTLVRVSLVCEACPRHGSNKSGESKSDLSVDNVYHCKICCPIATDPIYKPSSESDSEGDREIFMVK